MNLEALNLEAEYNDRARVPEHPAILAQMDIDAAAYRAKSPNAEYGLGYGSSERQVIDLFSAKAGVQNPLALFIHGGYWRTNHWSSYSHMASSLNSHGVDVAVTGYDLCPQVSIATIIDEMRAAVLYLWRKRRQRMLVFGHSAGGHLAACMLATGWSKFGAPADLVPCAYSISGVFDLTPLTQVSMNQELRLDDAEAKKVSPLFWPVPNGGVLDAVVGGAESSEFIRQSRIIAEGWKDKAQTRFEEIPGANHFTVVGPLQDANSAMVMRLVALAKQANARLL
jgi:arylformamidase